MLDIHKHIKIEKLEDIFLVEVGDEQKSDPRNIIDIAFHIQEIFEKEKENLFGYNILLISIKSLPQLKSTQIINQYKPVFLSFETDEKIWVEESTREYFYKYLNFEKMNGYWTVSLKKKSEESQIQGDDATWINLPVKEELSGLITSLINGDTESESQEGTSGRIIHIYGPPGTGKSLLINELIPQIFKSGLGEFIPRTFTRFKKSSLIHPLLNSISASFLEEVPNLLKKHELKTWESKGIILKYLKSTLDSEKSPDHIFEDFFICYSLYLTAYVRLMEANLYPALFICDDLTTYHKKTLIYISRLLNNFLQIPAFLPVLISRRKILPPEFNSFQVDYLEVHPLELKDIKNIADTKFRDIALSEKQIETIKGNFEGKIVPTIHSLLYLKNCTPDANSAEIPETHDAILWTLIEKMDTNEKDILFSIYVTGGMLSEFQLNRFLIKFGMKQIDIDRILEYLINSHITQRQNKYLVPMSPTLRPRLEKNMGMRGNYLKELISDFVFKLWEEKELPNLVLLFSFMMNHSTPKAALQILPLLLKRKIDERDLTGAKPFLKIKNFSFTTILSPDEHLILNMIILSGKIRVALLENKLEEAETAAQYGETKASKECSIAYKGDLNLNLARYYLAIKDLDSSIKKTKATLIELQDAGDQERIGEAYKLLGQAMLGGGKLNDAIDYFELADRFLNEQTQPYEKIQAISWNAITNYLKGRLTKSLTLIDKGYKIAVRSTRRDYELLFLFFKARILFDYGEYGEAGILFQKGLTVARIYTNTKAMEVLYNWLGRSMIYNKQTELGLSLLEKNKKSKENLLYLSEAYYLLEMTEKATTLIEKADSFPCGNPELSDELISWETGFVSIEGRCLEAFKNDSQSSRLVEAFKAFLYGLDYDIVGGINTLQAITRGDKLSALDPCNHYYYFLYALLLYKHKDKGKDKDDSLTILNQAIKKLQERASNIEEPMDRTKYLNKNLWNGKLLKEGRLRKLL